MKRKVLISAIFLIVSFGGWMYFAPRIRVDLAAGRYDPNKLDLRHIPTMQKSMRRTSDEIETGFLHLKDGSKVKYWYVSGHVQPGLGLTRFDFADGEAAYLSGVFCCEVGIGEAGLENKASLLKFIADFDGSPP